jgi:SAM-dependent methyltransferase
MMIQDSARSDLGASSRPCVICDADAGPRVFQSQLDICGLGAVNFGIRCCAACGMVQQSPAVSGEVLAQQYRLFSNYTQFDQGDPPLSAPAARMLALLERRGIAPGRVYDVGAATGAALWHFRQRGWTVSGCDPSPKAVEQASLRNGIALDLGDEHEALPALAKVDLITFSHVIEHLFHPRETLARARQALADDGLLLLEVPCLAAPEINPPGLFMLEHLSYFDEASIRNLLAATGFEALDSEVTVDNWPFPVITVLARRASDAAPLVSGFEAARDFCERYIAADDAAWARSDARLRAAIEPGEAVCVWGAGVHTSTLLERTSLATHARLVAITDRDEQKHGHALGRYRIAPPDEVLAMGLKVVISSYVSEAAIARALEGAGLPPERIVRLYTDAG